MLFFFSLLFAAVWCCWAVFFCNFLGSSDAGRRLLFSFVELSYFLFVIPLLVMGVVVGSDKSERGRTSNTLVQSSKAALMSASVFVDVSRWLSVWLFFSFVLVWFVWVLATCCLVLMESLFPFCLIHPGFVAVVWLSSYKVTVEMWLVRWDMLGRCGVALTFIVWPDRYDVVWLLWSGFTRYSVAWSLCCSMMDLVWFNRWGGVL